MDEGVSIEVPDNSLETDSGAEDVVREVDVVEGGANTESIEWAFHEADEAERVDGVTTHAAEDADRVEVVQGSTVGTIGFRSVVLVSAWVPLSFNKSSLDDIVVPSSLSGDTGVTTLMGRLLSRRCWFHNLTASSLLRSSSLPWACAQPLFHTQRHFEGSNSSKCSHSPVLYTWGWYISSSRVCAFGQCF